MKIRPKITIAMLCALSLAFAAYIALFAPRFRAELLNEHIKGSSELNAMLQITLENAMLKRDLNGLTDIVARLGERPNVRGVMILSPEGEVRFSSRALMLGDKFPIAALCPNCRSENGKMTSNLLIEQDGQEVVRAVNAVANRAPCQTCHGSIAVHPINGYLVIDYLASGVRGQALSFALAQGLGGLVIIIGGLTLAWIMIAQLVIRPVRKLAQVSAALSIDDFSARAQLINGLTQGDDEIAELGRSLKQMADRIEGGLQHMAESRAFLQAVIDSHPDGLRVIDSRYRVIAANRAFCDLHGLTHEQVLARPCHQSSYGRESPCPSTMVACPIHELKNLNGPIISISAHMRADNGQSIGLEKSAVKIKLTTRHGVKHYIVESFRKLDQQLHVSQEQRLSEIGQLAAGVAHEIHNPLSSIRLGMRAIQSRLGKIKDLDAEMRDYFAVVEEQIDRCVSVTDRLMRLSRIPSDQGVLINVAKTAEDVVMLLRYEAELRKVVITIDAPSDLRIVAGEGEFSMILLNLVQNAFHAMPEGGKLDISARARGDGAIEINVKDNGVGIDSDNLPLIFLPFWSNRHDGTIGSGLGLTMSHALMKKRAGKISVTSVKGQGAIFRLMYPNPDIVADDESPQASDHPLCLQ